MISFGHLSFATLHLPRNDIPHGRFNQTRTTCEEGVQSSCPSVDPMPLKFLPLLAVIFSAGAVTKPLKPTVRIPASIMVAGDLSLCNQLRLRELG